MSQIVLHAEKVREWYLRLNDAVLGEVGISWQKYHKVLDEMKAFVEEQEKRLQAEEAPSF